MFRRTNTKRERQERQEELEQYLGQEMKTIKVHSSEDSPRRVLTDHGLRKGLRQYISKNKAIPGYFEFADQDRETQQVLLPRLISAVATGNYDDDIFANPVCDDLILYAIEKELIDFWPGMTGFTYVTALAQFTNRRSLKIADSDVKSVRGMSITTMVQDGKITEFGDQYLAELSDFLRAYGVKHKFADLRNAILALPAFEQSLIRINRQPDKKKHGDDVTELLGIMCSNLPFCDGGDGKTMLLPSYGLVNVILQQIEAKPLQMKPVFGRLSDATRDALHAQDQHPVSLYLNSVKSNIPQVHSKRAGPIPIWLHDIGHTVWGTLLGFDNRMLINQRIMQIFDRVLEELWIHDDMKALKGNFNDYDLSPLPHFMNPQEGRLGHYSAHCAQHVKEFAVVKRFRDELEVEVKKDDGEVLRPVLDSVNDILIRAQAHAAQVELLQRVIQARGNQYTAFQGFGNVVVIGPGGVGFSFFGGGRQNGRNQLEPIDSPNFHKNGF